jgi:hypothetical protein
MKIFPFHREKINNKSRSTPDLVSFLYLRKTKQMEYLGYLASALVVLSFAMKNMTILRWINLLGCGVFVIYGFHIMEWPIIITNVAIVFINCYYLFRKK